MKTNKINSNTKPRRIEPLSDPEPHKESFENQLICSIAGGLASEIRKGLATPQDVFKIANDIIKYL